MLVARDPRSLEVLKPFLTGEDLNSHPEHSPSRFIIDFGSMDLEEAALYGELFEIVETKVKPVRDKNKHTERREKWWMFGGRAESIRSKIAGLEAVIVIAQVSKTAMPVRVSNDSVYSNKVIIFNSGSFEDLAILSSSIHYWWAIHTCGTMREDLSYSPHDCLETLPVVTSTTLLPQLAEYGRRLQGYRSDLMKDRWIGLTSLYNFYHRSAEMSEDISGLRMVHCDVDNAVLDAYGWDDIDLDHGFHETRQGQRYTIGPEARRKLLERLLLLNREQFTAEDAQETRTGTRNGVKDSQSRSKSHPDSSRSLF